MMMSGSCGGMTWAGPRRATSDPSSCRSTRRSASSPPRASSGSVLNLQSVTKCANSSLGSDPVLAPEERFYQRLLAANVEEAVELAETYVDEKSSQQFYDEVAIPALRLAENDRQRSTSEIGYRRVVADGATAVVREVAEHVSETESTTGEG